MTSRLSRFALNVPEMVRNIFCMILWALFGFAFPLSWHCGYYAHHSVEQIGGDVEWAVTLPVVLTMVVTFGFAIDWMARGGGDRTTASRILQGLMIVGMIVCFVAFLAR